MPRRRRADRVRRAGRLPARRQPDGDQPYLETFYNERAPRNTYVPYGFWETRRRARAARPRGPRGWRATPPEAPEATRRIVLEELARLTGRADVRLADRLAQDLGLDSLASAELVLWIEKEFGFSVGTPESLVTVGDVVLAAVGQGHLGDRVAAAGRRARPGRRRAATGGSRFPTARRSPRSFLDAGVAPPRSADPRRPDERRGDVSPPRARADADGAGHPPDAGPIRRHHAARVGRRRACSTWPRCSPARRR